MIFLKIDNGKGFYYSKDNVMVELDKMHKEDILFLLDQATDPNIEFEMDTMSDGNIQNEAHRIIYDALYKKFDELLKNKNRFLDECESLYREAFSKYDTETEPSH